MDPTAQAPRPHLYHPGHVSQESELKISSAYVNSHAISVTAHPHVNVPATLQPALPLLQ